MMRRECTWFLEMLFVLLRRKGVAGICNLQVMNRALLCKWLWRFGHEESLWHQVVAVKFHIEDGWHPRVA